MKRHYIRRGEVFVLAMVGALGVKAPLNLCACAAAHEATGLGNHSEMEERSKQQTTEPY